MPYKVERSGGGYKTTNEDTGKTYSKKPQSREMATKQMHAIAASEFGHGASAHK